MNHYGLEIHSFKQMNEILFKYHLSFRMRHEEESHYYKI